MTRLQRSHVSRVAAAESEARPALTKEEVLAAKGLALFLREGIQPTKGDVHTAAVNPHVIGEALLSEGILVGSLEVDQRFARLKEGIEKYETH